jgi:hypothetical protein
MPLNRLAGVGNYLRVRLHVGVADAHAMPRGYLRRYGVCAPFNCCRICAVPDTPACAPCGTVPTSCSSSPRLQARTQYAPTILRPIIQPPSAPGASPARPYGRSCTSSYPPVRSHVPTPSCARPPPSSAPWSLGPLVPRSLPFSANLRHPPPESACLRQSSTSRPFSASPPRSRSILSRSAGADSPSPRGAQEPTAQS